MTKNWPKGMDYSPWFGSILCHFENPSFPAKNILEEFYIHSERDYKVIQVDWG